MRPGLLPVLLVIPAALAGAGLARERPEPVPAATPTGPAVSCIPLTAIRETRIRDDRTSISTPAAAARRSIA